MSLTVKWPVATDGFARFRGVRRELFVGSLTSTGTTATLVAEAHGLSTGNKIRVYGWDQEEYNGDHTVTVTDVDTLTFSVSNADSPATADGIPGAGYAAAYVNGGTATATFTPDVGAGTISGDYKTGSNGLWIFPVADTLTFTAGTTYTMTAVITASSGEKLTATLSGPAVTYPA